MSVTTYTLIEWVDGRDDFMEFKMGELFSGPGGMALGAHRAAEATHVKLLTTWANDYDLDTCNTYRENVPGAKDAKVIHADVRDLKIDELEKIDGFAYGFPCNDFSLVGQQKGINGDFGPLYSYGVDVLNTHNPSWFVAENVGGLQSSNDGETFKLILEELSQAGDYGGYTLTPHLYKFEQYGLPQRRHRIIIVGIRNDLGVDFRVPSREDYAHIDNSVKKALSGVVIPDWAKHHEFTRHSEHVIERLQHIKPGQNAFTADLPEHLRLQVKGAKISQIYKRLTPDQPSYTLTGSGGGGTHVYHWEEPRALTNRERARLQTFPDEYVFSGGKESIRKQIGMAVPVAGAQVVFEALFKTFTDIPYNSETSNLQEFTKQKIQ